MAKFNSLLQNRNARAPAKAFDHRTLKIEALETRRLLALNPTADEQEFMQLVNRFRTDPVGEFSRLISRTSPITARDSVNQIDLDFANVNGNTLKSELQAMKPTHPVAWNEAVRNYNVGHNRKIIARGTHFHSSSTERRETLIANGVNLRFMLGENISSEIVFGYGKSVAHAFAAYVIDWNRGGPGGMASGRGHRLAIHNPHFEQAGNAITNHSGTGNPPLGPKISSSILVNIENPPVFVTGAVFQDRNASRWYEAGEGLRSVKLTFEDQHGKTYQTTGFTTGGYQIELPTGTYTATATGGGMKYTQRMSNIVVGSVNVWKNWIYDPNVIPADALESNNSRGAATPLTGGKQSFTGLSIHSSSDADYFKLTPRGSGSGTFSIQFSNLAGNLDLQLLNASGSLIASSTTAANSESLTSNLVRGSTYYVRVFGNSGAKNGSYSLTIDPPQPVPPVAVQDRAIFSGVSASIQIDVLSNDSNPDGSHAALTPKLAAGTHSAFKVTSKKQVEYAAPAGYSGVHRANYSVSNDQGLNSSAAQISVFVVNFENPTPWQNDSDGLDVNDDGQTTAVDVLLVVNELNNTRGDARLPADAKDADQIFGFVDVSGDGFITPVDALLIVNRINAEGEGEFETPNPRGFYDEQEANDLAVMQLAAADAYADLAIERRKILGG